MIYWIFACETTYPICVKWYGKFYPASGVFFLAWLLAFTKSFGWLVCRVVGLFTCKQTSARRVVKFYCHSWSPISEDLHVKAHVKPHVKCMWNNVWITGCFAIQWGLSTCESLCETPCEVYVKMCVKGLTSFHTLFTYISLCKISHACEICVWNACEKCVKNVWKTCEKSVKIGHFSHVFYMVFHIHTPSSEKDYTLCYLPLGLNWFLNPIMAAWYSFWKLNWCTQTWLSRKTNN